MLFNFQTIHITPLSVEKFSVITKFIVILLFIIRDRSAYRLQSS